MKSPGESRDKFIHMYITGIVTWMIQRRPPFRWSKIAILMFALLAVVVLLGTIGAYSYSGSLMVEEELSRGEALIWVGQEYISMVMFVTLALLLFSGYPVAFILGGLAMLFGLLGYFLDSFTLIEYFNFIPRIWGQA